MAKANFTMTMPNFFKATSVCIIYCFFAVINADCLTAPPKPFLLPLSNCTIPPNIDFQYGVDSWGLQLSIASQNLCVVPSLVVNNTVITETELCTQNNDDSSTVAQCISRRGGTFNDEQGSSSYSNISVQSLAPDAVWGLFNLPFGGAGNATVQLPSGITISDFPIALVLEGQNLNANQLGLANTSVLLHSLVSAGLSSTMSFGLFPGSQSITQPRDGQIVFGGYDAALVDGSFTNYTMSNTTVTGDRPCSLEVDVLGLTLRLPNGSDIDLLSPAELMPSCIEPYDNLFRLPGNVITQFQTSIQTSFGLNNDTSLVSPQLYVVEPGIYYNTSFDASLVFTLAGGLEVVIPSYELVGPLRGIDPNGTRVLQSDVTMVNIFNSNAPLGTASLGKVFLSQLYLTVNYHTQQFQLANVVSGNGLTSDLVSFDSSAPVGCPVDNSVSGGDIGVIVVGSTLAIILIVILFLWFYKWRDAWNEMKTKKVPTDVLAVVGLKENVQNLTERMEEVEVIVRPQPRRHEVEGHGVEALGRHESIGSSEMADTSNLESIVRNLTGRMDAMEAMARPQPIRRGTNPFRNGTGPGQRQGSNASAEMPDTSPLDLVGRIT